MTGMGDRSFGDGVFGADDIYIVEVPPQEMDIGVPNHSISSDEWLLSEPAPDDPGGDVISGD